jgi:hypothetical protein
MTASCCAGFSALVVAGEKDVVRTCIGAYIYLARACASSRRCQQLPGMMCAVKKWLTFVAKCLLAMRFWPKQPINCWLKILPYIYTVTKVNLPMIGSYLLLT